MILIIWIIIRSSYECIFNNEILYLFAPFVIVVIIIIIIINKIMHHCITLIFNNDSIHTTIVPVKKYKIQYCNMVTIYRSITRFASQSKT